MQHSLKGRSLLTLLDFNRKEVEAILHASMTGKSERRKGTRRRRFEGYSMALLFEKRSTRTRCAFETAFGEEGGHPVFLSTQDIHLGEKESIEDTARVLGRMFDAIEFRGYRQETAETLARFSGIPVYNGLTDRYHPTQALADLMTIQEWSGHLEGVSLCYVGDGRNNVARSLAIASALMGLQLTIASPAELAPPQDLLNLIEPLCAASAGSVRHASNIVRAVDGANAIYTDVWASMGEESEASAREELLRPYQVNSELLATTGRDDTYVLHCLPAIKGKEITAEVLDGPKSAAWDQAENRKHTIKALISLTLGT